VTVGAVAGDAAQRVEAGTATPAQLHLRRASKAFTDHAAAAGWVEQSGTGAARQALDVLIHGLDDAEKAEPRAADAFIEARGYGSASPAEQAEWLESEIREARAGVRTVNAAAAIVVLGPERAAWSRREDVLAAEAVVRAAHRARTVLRDAAGALGEGVDEAGRAAIDGELANLDLELERLSEAADALSMARPDVDLEQVDVIDTRPGVG
jgi:hypothetical protein